MTNYDMTMDMLAASTFHPDSVEQARKYLRYLKASHDLAAETLRSCDNLLNGHVLNNYENTVHMAVRAALKSAEALR